MQIGLGQLVMRDKWDVTDKSVFEDWTDQYLSDRHWWLNESHLSQGVTLKMVLPDHIFWSEASDMSFGANLVDQFASGRWSLEESNFISFWELRIVSLGLQHSEDYLAGSSVARFCTILPQSLIRGRWEYSFQTSQSGGPEDFAFGRGEGYHSHPLVYSRNLQCLGRLLQQGEPGVGV